jgi:hypothetical protein
VKTFHYQLGHVAGETMTVAELRAKLSEYPDDMPVFGYWEGCCGYVRPNRFTVEPQDKGDSKEECACLLIDVEEY